MRCAKDCTKWHELGPGRWIAASYGDPDRDEGVDLECLLAIVAATSLRTKRLNARLS